MSTLLPFRRAAANAASRFALHLPCLLALLAVFSFWPTTGHPQPSTVSLLELEYVPHRPRILFAQNESAVRPHEATSPSRSLAGLGAGVA